MKTKMQKLTSAGGILASPVFALLSVATKSQAAAKLALRFDAENFRVMASSLGTPAENRFLVAQLLIAAKITARLNVRNGRILKGAISFSKSQLLQDVFCLIATSEKRSGFFVEVGVGNGTDLSNTYLLEKNFGWSGILVEPNTSYHSDIRSKRSAILDPRAATSRSGDVLTFEEMQDEGMHSRLAGTSTAAVASEVKKYQVETASLDSILDGHNAPDVVDYISIDTEGNEMDVLSGLSLKKRQVNIFTIEHNFEPGKIEKIKSFFGKHEYVPVFEDVSSFDLWLVHRSIASKLDIGEI
ncbi:FkbM family methyltransferase [Mesorhizobium mediterraneum]|uniref:FkbM family methyltransferase n=1 Tax=Mesorhizobium mediterraneum TaxID=43617 RepID=UPI00177E7B5D|nr:FkbM family methyltransferase [Mesorhizobium mediterraneum]